MRGFLQLCFAVLATTGCGQERALSTCVPALPGWASPETGKPVHVIANTVELDGRNISWNGVAINEKALVQYVRQSADLNPLPFLVFDPGPAADCSFARHIRDTLDREYPCRIGGCWHGSKEALDKAPFTNPRGSAVP